MHIVSLVGLRLPLEILLCFAPCSLLTEHFSNIFVFVTTQSCARGLCDTHLPDLNHSGSQSKRSSCSRVSRDWRNRGVSGASSPSRVIYHTFCFLCTCFPFLPALFSGLFSLRVIYHTFDPHFACFVPALLSCLSCLLFCLDCSSNPILT